MVALHRIKPGRIQEFQTAQRIRAAINQVANRKQPVARRVEAHVVEQAVEQIEAALTDRPLQSRGRLDWKAMHAPVVDVLIMSPA